MPIIGPGGSGSGGLSLLYDSTLGAGATSFDSGAGGFNTGLTVLYIYITIRGANAVVGSQGCLVRFNGDSGANYNLVRLNSINSVATATTAVGQTSIGLTIADAGNSAGMASAIAITVPNYGGTTFNKGGIVLSGFGDTSATGEREDWFSFGWANTAAISRVQVLSSTADNFLTGSRITILAS